MKDEKAQVRQLCFLIVESRQAFEHRPLIPISKLSALSTCGDGLLARDKSPAARMGPTYRCHLSAMVHKIQNPPPPESSPLIFFKK